MANLEIKEGIKSALARGETLKQAVNSFLNAGYDPLEVERASKELEGGQSFFVPKQPVNQGFQPARTSPRVSPTFVKKPAVNYTRNNFPAPIQNQKISNYEYASSDEVGRKILIFGLVALLIILIAGLGFIFFFQEQVSSFLSNLFS